MSGPLKKYLSDVLADWELSLLVQSYDVVGDIAIIVIPQALRHRERLVGEAVLASNARIRVVARRAGGHDGEFRTRSLKVIAGENRKETLHREYGVRLLVNVEEAYFSARSGTERYRVARCVRPEETVLVCFSGVAPYPLMIAAHSAASLVVGIEKNPKAHQYAVRNCTLNKCCQQVQLFEGDVACHVPRFDMKFNRIILPLPYGGIDFLPLVLSVLKSGGWIHLYAMGEKNGRSQLIEEVENICQKAGREIVAPVAVKAGHCASGVFRFCIEGEVC